MSDENYLDPQSFFKKYKVELGNMEAKELQGSLKIVCEALSIIPPAVSDDIIRSCDLYISSAGGYFVDCLDKSKDKSFIFVCSENSLSHSAEWILLHEAAHFFHGHTESNYIREKAEKEADQTRDQWISYYKQWVMKMSGHRDILKFISPETIDSWKPKKQQS